MYVSESLPTALENDWNGLGEYRFKSLEGISEIFGILIQKTLSESKRRGFVRATSY